MAEAEAERRGAKPASGKSTFLTLAVVLLLGLVGWLLAERNARQFFLVFEDGALAVKKGVLFPVGKTAFKTDDPSLAVAYAPLKPPPGAKLDEERAFDDRAGLDQALYEHLARWARDDLASEKPDGVERAMGWLSRADKLAGLAAVQRDDLRALRAESGWFEARQLLEKASDALRQARERLRLTSGSSSPHAADASEALRRVDPVVDEVYRAARLLAPAGAPRAEQAPPPHEPAAPAAPAAAEVAPPAPSPGSGK